VDVIVEFPSGSRNKYEFDHERNVMRLDRRLFTATRYPSDYGFVSETLSLDGDPRDALVILVDPTFPGCRIRPRIIGVLFMTDEAGPDAKLLTVLADDPMRDYIVDLHDLSEHHLDEIAHFFSIYKDLEPNKTSDPATSGVETRHSRSSRLVASDTPAIQEGNERCDEEGPLMVCG
jgi:inorganic pyrophosphatase